MAAKKKAKKAAKKKVAPKASRKAKAKTKVKAKASAKAVVAAPKKPAVPVPPSKPILVTPKNSSSRQFTQNELLECIRGSCGFVNRVQAREFYSAFAGMVQSALKSGYRLVLPGLGKIQVKKRKARMGRNPATQQPMMIPAKRKVAFTAMKAMKEAVL